MVGSAGFLFTAGENPPLEFPFSSFIPRLSLEKTFRAPLPTIMVLLTEPKTPRSSRTSRRAALSSTPSSKSRSKSPRSTRSPAPPKPSPDKSKRAKSSSGPYQYDPGTTPWTLTCASHYNAFLSAHRPALRCVTFLVFSGIRDAGYTAFAYYSAPSMIGPYAYAFQVHQKPIRTKALHVFFMTNLPYLIYLPLIAAPVDVVVHTLQFFWGENMFFFEGGLLFVRSTLTRT